MKNSFIKLMNFLGITDGKEMTFEEYFESIKARFQNNEVYIFTI